MTTWPGLCCTPRSATCSRSCKEGKHGRDLRSPSHCACAQRIPREIRHPAPERRRAGAALGADFTPEFRNPDALRGIEGFDRLWLIWEFSANRRASWSPTVRPPRLGGNTRLGVFATRSPFRPNPLGMSCVVLTGVRQDAKLGPVLCLSGADLMDGTPVFDIKPYLPYSDCFPDARAGFTALAPDLLLGKPVRTSAFMPAIAADAKTIAFGDFSYYWIADRQGRSFKRLNELYAATGQVGFLASQRVDGKLILPEAIKVLAQKSAG